MSGIIELRQRIRGIRTLDEVVHAMRSIAGVRLRQAQRAFAGLAAYERTVAEALGMALAFWPEAGRNLAERAGRGPRALVLIGSEHGFVGAYNEHLVAEAGRDLAPGDRLIVVGARAARLARRHGLAIAARHPMPARVDHATAAALALAEAVWPDYRAGTVARIALLHSRTPAGEAPTPACVPLAPLAMAAAPVGLRQPPLSNLPPEELVGRIAGELLVARLIRGLVEALEAENLLRMRAMERAQRNVQRRLEELRLGECRLAQELTTNEILELVNASA